MMKRIALVVLVALASACADTSVEDQTVVPDSGNNGAPDTSVPDSTSQQEPDARPDPGDVEGGDTDEPMDVGADTPDEPDTNEPDTNEPDTDEPDGPVPNDGWIGGACEGPADCDYDDAICLTEEQGFPGGTCSQGCDRFCPDRDGMNSVTFCVENQNGDGVCVSRCDHDLYPDGGCRDGYRCRILPRFEDPGTSQGVCIPDDGEGPDPDSDCLEAIEEAGVIWTQWNYETQHDGNLACDVPDPVRVQSPIAGVSYRYVSNDTPTTMSMGCPLARALVRLSEALRQYDIVEVIHIGTFNCRRISGTDSLSQHGYGLAIDIYGLVDSQGQDYILERDWEHDTDNPQTEKGRFLYELGQRMYNDRIFNIILTPNFNSAHDNHFHVDLTEGSHFIGYGGSSYFIGPNEGH